MDLEILKSQWSEMNDRMEQQEIFKEKMFRQILNTKSDKSLNRLMAYEVISMIFSVLFIPFLLFIYYKKGMEMIRPVVVGAIIFMIVGTIWYVIKVLVLSKINFSKTLKNNLLYVNKYAIYIKYEKLFIYYILIPVLFALCTFYYIRLHASLYSWVIMSCVGIAAILYTIYFYHLYNKNISTIRENLDELRSLEDNNL